MELIKNIFESIQKGNYFIAVVLVILITIIRLKEIINFYYEFKQYKIRNLRNLYNEDIDQSMKKMLQNYINNEIFYQLTGIRAEKFLRDKIVETYEKAQGLITYKDLKSAQRFLVIDDGELKVKVTIFDKIDKWFNLFLSIILIFITSYLFLLPSFINKPSLTQILISFSFGVFTYIFAGFLIALTFPIKKAEKIKKLLRNLKHSN